MLLQARHLPGLLAEDFSFGVYYSRPDCLIEDEKKAEIWLNFIVIDDDSTSETQVPRGFKVRKHSGY